MRHIRRDLINLLDFFVGFHCFLGKMLSNILYFVAVFIFTLFASFSVRTFERKIFFSPFLDWLLFFCHHVANLLCRLLVSFSRLIGSRHVAFFLHLIFFCFALFALAIGRTFLGFAENTSYCIEKISTEICNFLS